MTLWQFLILCGLIGGSVLAFGIVVARRRARLAPGGKPTGQEARRQQERDRRQALLMAATLGIVQVPIGIAAGDGVAMIVARVVGVTVLTSLLGLATMWAVRR